VAVHARTGMQKVVASDNFRVGIGEKCIRITGSAAQVSGHVGRVYANGYGPNPHISEIGQLFFYTPQLGVAERSPIAAIENQQHAPGSAGGGNSRLQRRRENCGKGNRVVARIAQSEVRGFLSHRRGPMRRG
jgi:hypothetical protein